MLRQTGHAEALAKSMILVNTLSTYAILRNRLGIWKTAGKSKTSAVWVRTAITDTTKALEDETSRMEEFMRNAPPNITPEGAKVSLITSSGGMTHVEMTLPADCVFGIVMHENEFNKIAMAKKDCQNLQKDFRNARFFGIASLVCYGATGITLSLAVITSLSSAFSSFLSIYVPIAFGVAGVVFDVIAERIEKSIPPEFEEMVSVDESVKTVGSIKKEILEILGRIEKALG